MRKILYLNVFTAVGSRVLMQWNLSILWLYTPTWL